MPSSAVSKEDCVGEYSVRPGSRAGSSGCIRLPCRPQPNRRSPTFRQCQCADFERFYNRDRPHSSYAGLTPDEVATGAKEPSLARGRVTYFDGRMKWYAFG
jgi:hypothetical protein